MSKELSSVPTLEKDNYPEWTRKINAYFRLNNLYNIVHGRELRPADSSANQPDWDKRAMQAAGAIEMSLDNTNATHIHGIEGNATAMWMKLESVHNSRTPGSRFNAMDTFFNIKKEEQEDLRSLVTRAKAAMQVIKSLRPVGTTSAPGLPTVVVTSTSGNSTSLPSTSAYTLETLDEELVIMALLRALPEDYSALRSSLFIQDTLTLQMVENAFQAEDNQRQHSTHETATALQTSVTRKSPSLSTSHRQSSTPPSSSSAPLNGPRQHKNNLTCFFCKNPGHHEADCRVKKNAQENYLKRRSNNANATSVTTSDADTETTEEFAASASTVPIPTNAQSDLNADTGATRLMMGNENFFSSLRPMVQTIRLANGAPIQSKGEGDVVFQPWVNGRFDPSLIVFPNVLFAPNLQSNLVSVLTLVRKHGYEVRINKERMEFYNGGILRMTAHINSNCVAYLNGRVIPAEVANAVSTCPLNRELWHRRLAHINLNTLESLICLNLLNDLQLDSNSKPDPICTPCISGKQTRAVHTTPGTRSTVLLHRVSTDLHGPIHTEALPSRAKYWMSFVDEASGYVFLSLLRTKDEAFEAFQRYKTMAENQTAHRIKHLHDDKGGEFVSEKFQRFCDEAGIMREHTIRATPEQNGRVERVNHWIAEGTTAKLIEANLPPSFWGLAALACVHEMNRARIHEKKTPYEHWHGERPSVKRLRIFGCAAYVHVQKDQRRALEAHTKKCIFVGYPSNRTGWMFWDQSSRKLIYSDSAIFDERNFPGTKLPKETTPELLPELQFELVDERPTEQNVPAPPELPAENPLAPIPLPKEHPPPLHDPPHDEHPLILVGGQPVPPPEPPAGNPPAPPIPRRAPLSRELRALLDETNFEKRL